LPAALAAGFLLLTWPTLSALRDGDFTTLLIVDGLGCALLATTEGVMAALFCELFPARGRPLHSIQTDPVPSRADAVPRGRLPREKSRAGVEKAADSDEREADRWQAARSST